MMDERDLDGELRGTAFQVLELSRRVDMDPTHKARLREELLRRHHELNAENTQRAALNLWPHFTRLKRLTLVAPPALAAAVAFSVLLWALQITGHQKTQTADAARITHAMAHSTPYVTGWEWTLRRTTGSSLEVLPFRATLKSSQRLFVFYHRVYLYSAGHWSLVSWDLPRMTQPIKLTDWEWVFASVPSLLKQQHLMLLPRSQTRGSVQGLRYALLAPHDRRVTVTAWVSPTTGLVSRVERVITRRNALMERDSVDYHFKVSG